MVPLLSCENPAITLMVPYNPEDYLATKRKKAKRPQISDKKAIFAFKHLQTFFKSPARNIGERLIFSQCLLGLLVTFEQLFIYLF